MSLFSRAAPTENKPSAKPKKPKKKIIKKKEIEPPAEPIQETVEVQSSPVLEISEEVLPVLEFPDEKYIKKTVPIEEFPKETQPSETKDELINRYSYGTTYKEKESELKAVALTEESFKEIEATVEIPEIEKIDINNYVTLLDLSSNCELKVIEKLTQPISLDKEKLYELEYQFLQSKMQAIAKEEYDIIYESIKDKVFIKDGIIVIPEELFSCSGFLREYFGIEEVLVIIKNGSVVLRQTEYNNYWTKERIEGLRNKDRFDLSFGLKFDESDMCEQCGLDCTFRNFNSRT